MPMKRQSQYYSCLIRLYIREDLDEADRWHLKCGHISMKYLKRMQIKSLKGKKLPDTFRCDACMAGKIHKMPHKNLHGLPEQNYLPGECIYTDLMGPYAHSLCNSRYAQILKDWKSTFRWCRTLTSKDRADTASEKIVVDSGARSGSKVRFSRVMAMEFLGLQSSMHSG